MKKYIYEEFVKYDANFRKGNTDFYGMQSPLHKIEQKEFLRKYYDYHTRRFGKGAAYEKAVSEAELNAACKKIETRRRTDGELSFVAYKKKKARIYRGWDFYTDRTFAQGGSVVFKDDYKWPVPCAKYEFKKKKALRFGFSVYIDGSFCHRSAEGILPTTTGRYVELRKGCREVIKLYFSPDGTFCYKDGKEERYHYSLHKIGNYEFDKQIDIEIIFAEKSFAILYNGKKHTFDYSFEAIPDTLFLGGGMQPTSGWTFTPRFLVAENGKEIFFEKDNGAESEENLIGNIALPFALGTEKNKDETLILRSSFFAKHDKKYVLHFGALDPGGEVLINGKTLYRTDSFTPFDLDISNALRVGENNLEIRVFPRAPEVLYAWHRHDDSYNAWFCLEVKLSECENVISSPLVIRTETVGCGKADFTLEWDTGLCGDELICDIFLQKIFPTAGDKVLLRSVKPKNGKLFEKFYESVDFWDIEEPNLYEVTAEIKNENGLLFSKTEETGFRTIEQKDGHILLNGRKTVLKGALNMQFLPPYDEIPVNHVCPSSRQISEQILAIKNMNGNCMRMHQLGYGCGDVRFAEIADRLGILLIWTTRLIDGAENLLWTDTWLQADEYKKQIEEVINSPSIIMWEGSNELHSDLKCLDKIYDNFITTVRSVDNTRLICPVSHLYYGGGIYELGCKYYNTIGDKDESGNEVKSSFGWRDKSVVRSAHTYSLLLGYGASWRDMAEQNWKWQKELFDEKQKAYIVSEFAVIGRQNPDTEEAKAFINKDSYELSDEVAALGYSFSDNEWQLSQAYQALCAAITTKQLRKSDADGMLWCSLWGGANNASYLKPIVDFYGYKKLAYYQLKDAFRQVTAFNEEPDVLMGEDYEIKPVMVGLKKGKKYSLAIQIIGESGDLLQEKCYNKFTAISDRHFFGGFMPEFVSNGYYTIRYTVTEV